MKQIKEYLKQRLNEAKGSVEQSERTLEFIKRIRFELEILEEMQPEVQTNLVRVNHDDTVHIWRIQEKGANDFRIEEYLLDCKRCELKEFLQNNRPIDTTKDFDIMPILPNIHVIDLFSDETYEDGASLIPGAYYYMADDVFRLCFL